MNYVNCLDLLGTPVFQIPCIKVNGVPSGTTEGAVGCLAMNIASAKHDLYKCVDATDGVYTWVRFDHEHLNKAELDKIQAGDVEKWNNKADLDANNRLKAEQLPFTAVQKTTVYFGSAGNVPVISGPYHIEDSEVNIADLAKKTQVANALKGVASGAVVALSDISPIEHIIECKVERKNLIPYPYVHSKIEKNGITFTANGDGSITVNGTATAYTSFTLSNVNKPVRVPVNTSVVFSSGYDNTDSTVQLVAKKIINGVISNAAYIYPKKTGNTFVTDVNEYNVYAYVKEGVTVDNVTIYPQIEIGTTGTGYEAYIQDLSQVYVKQYGKNMSNIMSKGTDGVITLNNGKANAGQSYGWNSPGKDTILMPAGTYTISCDYKNVGNTQSKKVRMYTYEYNDNTYTNLGAADDTAASGHLSFTMTLTKAKYIRIVLQNNATSTVYADGEVAVSFSNVQVEVGNKDTGYEAYVDPVQCPVNEDGTGEILYNAYFTLTTDTSGALLEVKYSRDINKAFAEMTNLLGDANTALESTLNGGDV